MAVRRIERGQEQRTEVRGHHALAVILVSVGAIIGTVGLLIGMLVSTATEPFPPPVIAAPNAQGTMEVNVDVTLHEATATPTALPTIKPTDAPTMDLHADDCSRANPEPGQTCRRDPLPTNTPQPLSECPAAMPGDLCVWVDPLTSGRAEAE